MAVGGSTKPSSVAPEIARRGFRLGLTVISKEYCVRPLAPKILEGRGKNAVAQLFTKHLIVPKIFFEAHWPNRTTVVDVLAVDRSGAGDLHAVEILADAKRVDEALAKLSRIPAHFKYIAYFSLLDEGESVSIADPEAEPDERLYATDGLGRVGTICLYQGGPRDALIADIAVQPERFRVPAGLYGDIDKYVQKHPADIAIRV
jgi:hypothetical protein